MVLDSLSGLSVVTGRGGKQRVRVRGAVTREAARGEDAALVSGRAEQGPAPRTAPRPGSAGALRGWKRQEVDSCLEPLEGSQPCGHLDFGLLTSRPVRGNPLVLRH